MEPRRGTAIRGRLSLSRLLRSGATSLAFLGALPAAAEPPHHRLEVELHPAENRLTARDRIRWEGEGPLRFTLHPSLKPKAVRIDGRPYAVETGKIPGSWVGEHALEAGEHKVSVEYHGRLKPGKEHPDFRDVLKGFAPRIGSEGTYLPPGGAWVPDLGRERITYRLQVITPREHRVAAAGKRQASEIGGDRRRVTLTYDRPIPGIALLGGPYRLRKGPGEAPVPADAYLHAGVADIGKDYLTAAEGFLREYEDRYGPYPHPRFSLVSSPWPTGFGFPGLAYIGRRILPLPFVPRTSLPHEILHNWWGSGVYVAPDSGNWAEGLTTYGAEYRLARKRSADDARTLRRQWLADYASYNRDGKAPSLRDFRARVGGASRTIGYNKAAFVWIMLRDRLGEKAFRKGLRRFYADFRHRHATWSDLRIAFEAVSDADLAGLFGQWLDRRGAPQPALADVQREDGTLTVVLTQSEPAYRLALPLRATFADGTTRTRVVNLDGARRTVHLDTGDKRAVRVRVDPDFRVFRRLTAQAVPPRLSDLLARETAGTIALSPELRSDASQKAAQRVGQQLWGGPPEVITASAGEAGEASVRVVPMAQLAERWHRLGADNQLPDWPDDADAGVAMARGPAGSGAIMLIGVRSGHALANLAHPLPHYGSYGWLAFRKGERLARGRWPVREPSLTWRASGPSSPRGD